MQDIRPEIRERIKQVQEERQKAQDRLAELERIEKSLQTVLESESALWERLVATLPLFESRKMAGNGTRTLSDLLLEFLRNGESLSLDKMKKELVARGFPFGEKAPGRVINFALVGLLNRRLVKKTGEGEWKTCEKQT